MTFSLPQMMLATRRAFSEERLGKMKSATDWYGQTLVKHCGLLSVWTDKAAANARPFAELFRQVTPRRSRPGYPENTIKNKTMVRGFASIWGADRQDEALVKRPFLVRHQVSCQAGLHRRYQLESRSARNVNPFCQHGLAIQEDLVFPNRSDNPVLPIPDLSEKQ